MIDERENSEKTRETPLTTSSTPSETLAKDEKKPPEVPPLTLTGVQDMRRKMLQDGPESVTEEELRAAIAFLRESRVSAMDSGKRKKTPKEKKDPIDTDKLLEEF